MVHFSEIESLRTSLQFLAFSDAYLTSAGVLCAALAASPAESSYPRGVVVSSLAFHGIELFLKAAILEKAPNEQFSGNLGHDIDHLSRRYANLYPGKRFTFDIPFRPEEINFTSLDPHVAEELQAVIAEHKAATPVDQVHRYPRDREGNPWEGLFAFEANSFARVIAQAQQDITRLKELVFHG